jgi:hypothetical protein
MLHAGGIFPVFLVHLQSALCKGRSHFAPLTPVTLWRRIAVSMNLLDTDGGDTYPHWGSNGHSPRPRATRKDRNRARGFSIGR